MPTHFFHSGMSGAPTNTNAAGSTLAIIDAILVTGFNLQSVLSATVASEVMTVNYAIPHGYEDKVLIRLDGAAGGSIVRRATVTGTQVLTIPAPGFADGAVAGTLSSRVAPADWERVFSDTGKAVFRSKVEGPGSTRFYYRVNDTALGSSTAEFRGFESMTDVDTGIGPFPTVAQDDGQGIHILRADSSTPRPWCAIADGRTLYLILGYNSTPLGAGRAWGDITPYASSDTFCAFTIGGNASYGYLTNINNTHYVPRVAAGTGTAQTGTRRSLFAASGDAHTYPSPIDGGMVFSRPVLVSESGSNAIRGEMRGMMTCSANPIPFGSLFTIMPTVAGVSGRVCVARDGSSSGPAVAFPIDEDWP